MSEYALDAFKNKKKTPTFGGALFVIVPIVVALILNGFNVNRDLWLLVLVFGSYAFIGFVDDYKIVTEGKNDGISPRAKMLSRLVLSVVFYVIYIQTGGDNLLAIPFVKQPIDLGIGYLFLIMFMFAWRIQCCKLNRWYGWLSRWNNLDCTDSVCVSCN
ncbi:hypothetical protein MGH68_13215 [Erysipelothrix sp. D19-032]